MAVGDRKNFEITVLLEEIGPITNLKPGMTVYYVMSSWKDNRASGPFQIKLETTGMQIVNGQNVALPVTVFKSCTFWKVAEQPKETDAKS